MRWVTAALALGLLSAGSCLAQQIQHWNQPAVSSPNWESHPAFDPRTGDLWFVRSDPEFSGWHLLVAHCERGSWQPAVPAPIAKPGLEADPWFSLDGTTLWFISTRRTGSLKSADLDIYRVQRTRDGTWAEPEPLPAPVNSDAAEWFPRPTAAASCFHVTQVTAPPANCLSPESHPVLVGYRSVRSPHRGVD
jgi:hypothetical protein